MLEVKRVSAYYGKYKALDNINLSFEKGKFYAIIGRNSSGKSTLIGCLASLMKYEGKIYLLGKKLSDYPLCDRAKKISILPQQVLPVPFTVYELISFGRNPYGDIKSVGKEKVNEAIKRAGIEKLCDKKVNELSGGERQLSYFAMNLCQDAEVMILDEPTSNLDIEHEAKILSLAKAQCNVGKTVICVIHNLSQAIKYADEVVILDGGKCVFSGSKETCLEDMVIEKSYGVRRFEVCGEVFFSV